MLLLLLAIIPFRYEKFNELQLEKSSCMDLLNSKNDAQYIIQNITTNQNRIKSVNDLSRVVNVTNTSSGPIYEYSDSKCILESDKLGLYGMTNACKLNNRQLTPTSQGDAIQGCIIDPKEPWFHSMLDEMYTAKNSGILSQISNSSSLINTLNTQNNVLASTLTSKQNEFVSASNVYNSVVNTAITYDQLYKDIQSQYDILVSKLSTSFGLNENEPAASAQQIREVGASQTDGIFYISCGGIAKPTYCLMDPRFDGGGWMLLMKMAKGNTFQFASQHWTSATTLNTTSLNMIEEDAKFEAFNTVPIKDVMAIFPASSIGKSGGSLQIDGYWIWICKDWYKNGSKITALNGFNEARDATPSNPSDFSGWDNVIFSSQTPSSRHVFGGHGHLGTGWSGNKNDWGTVRWGFVFNENAVNDFASNDAWAGLGGGSRNFEQGVHTFSAGDYYGCCGKKGSHTRFTCYLFGR